MKHIKLFEQFMAEGSKLSSPDGFPYGTIVHIGDEKWTVIPHPAYPKSPPGKVFLAPFDKSTKDRYIGALEYNLNWLAAHATKIEKPEV